MEKPQINVLANIIGKSMLAEYLLDIYKLGLTQGWEACDEDSQARSTGEFESYNLSQILERAEYELHKYIKGYL